jgi:hypothetical protein
VKYKGTVKYWCWKKPHFSISIPSQYWRIYFYTPFVQRWRFECIVTCWLADVTNNS